MADHDAKPNDTAGHDDPSRAGAGEGPDAQPDGNALDESEQGSVTDTDADPDHEKTDDEARAAEDEAAKLGDFA